MAKKVENPPTDVGVIIGRFQVDGLHEGQIDLIKFVQERHTKIIIFLGLSPVKSTVNNPLDFETRKQMILELFPDINVLYIKDQFSDDVWSKNLDNQIEDVISPEQTVTLYGSRDSFIKYYSGKHECIEMEQKSYCSGTDVRKKISNKVKSSSEFRAGAIWATTNQWPSALPTVDVAILNDKKDKVLLARKPYETQWRFVGGFVSPGSNLEQTVKREVHEETHLEIEGIKYICSDFIDDWRYKHERNKIITSFFEATMVFGRPTPDDDIQELKWFDIKSKKNDNDCEWSYINIMKNDIAPNHRGLMKKLEEHLNK